MSDFLARLARRAIGQADRVQPLVLPTFAARPDEPPTFNSLDGWLEEVADAEGSVDATGTVPGRDRAALPGEPGRRSPGHVAVPSTSKAAAPGEISTSGGAPTHRSTSLERAAREEAASAPIRGSERGSVSAGDRRSADSPEARATSSRSSRVPANEPVEAESPRLLMASDELFENRAVAAGPRRERLPESPADVRDEIGDSTGLTREQLFRPESSVDQPRSADASERTSGSEAVVGPGPVASAAEPSIQVTIGRIEVRAVTPAPSRAGRPRVSLSLDDYLKQRDGNRR